MRCDRAPLVLPAAEIITLARSPAPSFFVPRAPARLIPTPKGVMVASTPGRGEVPKFPVGNAVGNRFGNRLITLNQWLMRRVPKVPNFLARAYRDYTHTRAH